MFVDASVYVCIFALIKIIFVESQNTEYVVRLRNISLSSDTNSVYLVNFTTQQVNMQERTSVVFNVTQNIPGKYVEVTLYRCTYDRFTCENFQLWKFTNNINAVIYMKNQMWTPMFTNLHPRINLTYVKKAIYYMTNVTLDIDKVVRFYSEAAKYYYKPMITLYDNNNKRAVIIQFEANFIQFVKKDRKRNRRP